MKKDVPMAAPRNLLPSIVMATFVPWHFELHQVSLP